MDAPRTTHVLNGIHVDLGSETLHSGAGHAITLRPRAFATLRYLIGNADRLVSKEELNQAVWHGAAVSDDSLVQCIHEIRHALNDESHLLVRTVSRRGYRLHLSDLGAKSVRNGLPSIAVLPFEDLGEDRDQGYFADGLVEDVITGIARIPGLLVIARNSSFAYRGTATDVRTIAAELGVRYLLEGSVRRSGQHLRITARLVDGVSGGQVWAGRFDGDAAEVFDLQDRLTAQIAGIIEPTVRRAEIARAIRKPAGNLDAYDLYLRALPHAVSNMPGAADRALALLDEALRRDPGFMPAHGYAAWCHEQRYFRAGFDPADRAAALAHAAVTLGQGTPDPQAMSICAFVRANLTRDYDAALPVLDRALELNANSALAYGFSALVSAHSERDDRAVDHARTALRLSPLDDPLNYHPYCALALTSLFAGRFEDAAAYGNLTIRANPGFSVPYAYLAAANVHLDRPDAAHAAARGLIAVEPEFTTSGFARTGLFRAARMDELVAALRRAGLPET